MRARRERVAFEKILKNVPPVPVQVRYYDDFSDAYNELTQASISDQWTLYFDGGRATLDFGKFDVKIRTIVKSWCSAMLAVYAPRTVEGYFYGLSRVSTETVSGVLSSSPHSIRSLWKSLHASQIPYESFEALKSLLHFCCKFDIGSWKPEWSDLVSQLPLPKVDKYASVRTGDAFLSVDEQAAIVRHIDDVCAEIESEPAKVPDRLLELTAILVCSYQFAFRAKQIAMLETRNIRMWNDGLSQYPAVHLTFVMIKQRSAGAVFPMVRRLKREWSPLFIELFRRAQESGLPGPDHVFRRSPSDVSDAIGEITEIILGTRRGIQELRHSAAQRLVDAGASEEELAAFMGHTDLNTGLIYYRSSASQAERVNQALSVSAVYQGVVKIAHNQFISVEELAALKGDQQVAGVPHGIPISGIGGCTHGQPVCPYSPVLSCYGCSRFMPVAQAAVHKSVLKDLREVMKFFYASSRGDHGSPAFQMEETISSIQAVLHELGGQSDELLH
jgi:integrase